MKLRQHFASLHIDSAIITDPANVFYLSGFTGYGDGRLFITEQEAYLITDPRYTVQAAEEAAAFTVCLMPSPESTEFHKLILSAGVKHIGFEDAAISYADYRSLTESIDAGALLPLGDTLDILRMTKSEFEVRIIKKACDIAWSSFCEVQELIVPGYREIDIAAELEYKMRQKGAAKTSFDTIVASGPRSAMPHGTAGERVIRRGDCVTVDFGALYKGYCSDMTRTVFAEGEAHPELTEIYRIVQAAHDAAINGFQPGMSACMLDKLARDYIAHCGYASNFGHSLGHGVGVCIHEAPRVSARSMTLLQPGMIFSIEPGIYKEGLGGVRIEDLVLVRENGLEILTGTAR